MKWVVTAPRCAGAMMIALAIAVSADAAINIETLVVFSRRHTELSIVTSRHPAPEEKEAAELLARVLSATSGASFKVRREGWLTGDGIYVGDTRTAERLLPPLDPSIDRDGFRITVEKNRIYLQGVQSWGTRFGAAWFLQKFAGTRWFMPGPLGESIRRMDSLEIAVGEQVHEPAWLSREFWGLGPGGDEWASRNGLRRRFAFSHNLEKVFPPETADMHPEWFPLIDSERMRPVPGGRRWQPDFTRADVAGHAADVAAAHFKEHPDDASFSLGMNDTVRFDQSDATRAVVEPLRYHRGFPDYSDLIFGFMNRAAEALGDRAPGKKLGALAYFWGENTPRFPVSARVLPYLTTDRSQYYDADYAAADIQLMRAWRASGAETTGIYDYSYGTCFLVPRIYHGEMLRALNAAHSLGMQGYFAEMNSNWGFDAFKAWATARALWDGRFDKAELEDEFFKGFYGRAADDMRRFFKICEARWMGQGGQPYWLKLYNSEDQALLFTPEVCRELRTMIEHASAIAENDTIRARVAMTSRAFAVTEAFASFDVARRAVEKAAFASEKLESDPAPLLESYAATKDKLVSAYAAASAGEFPSMGSMTLDPFLRNDPRPALAWRHLSGCDPKTCHHLDVIDDVRAVVEASRLLAAREVPSLAANGSFEIAGGPMRPEFLFPKFAAMPTAWRCEAMPTEKGRAGVVETDAHDGSRALRVEGAWDTDFFRWLPALPDRIYILTGWLRGHVSAGNSSALVLSFLDENNNPVGAMKLEALPVGTTADWTEIVLADNTPPGAAWVGIGVSVSRQVDGDYVEADDLQLRCANPEWANQ